MTVQYGCRRSVPVIGPHERDRLILYRPNQTVTNGPEVREFSQSPSVPTKQAWTLWIGS